MASIPDRQTIEDLVRRAKEGDREASHGLFDLYKTRLEVLIYLRLGPGLRRFVEPEEILQKTHEGALRSIGRFELRGDHSFLSWLARIAENVIRNEWRRLFDKNGQLRMKLFSDGEDHEERLESKAPSLLRKLLREERLNALEAALRELRPRYRKVIILRCVFVLPFRLIADQLETTEPGSQELFRRAVVGLKKHFKPSFSSWGLPTSAYDRLGRLLGADFFPEPQPSTSTY